MYDQSTRGGGSVQAVEAAPPVTNRGVQVARGAVSDRIHWVGGTLHGADAVEAWQAVLPDDLDWVPLERGHMGYGASLRAGPFVIYHGGAAGMGAHVEVSGVGCDLLTERGYNWASWLAGLLAMGCKFTRLDLARDIVGGGLDISDLAARWDSHAVTSRWAHIVESARRVKGAGGVRDGHTLRFGSGASDVTCNVYDKRAERAAAAPAGDRAGILAGPSWVRVEFRLRRKRAHAAARAFVEAGGFGDWWPGLIRSYLDFKVDDVRLHSTSTRVPSLPAWDAFLEGAERCSLVVPVPVRTLDSVAVNLERQWGPYMGVLVKAYGDASILGLMVSRARSRWRPSHYRLLDTAAA